MKFLFVFLVSASAAFNASPQTTIVNQAPVNTAYLFPEFNKGTVRFKSGIGEQTQLNYNMSTHEMVFLKNGNPLALAQTENIDTIYLQQRRFITDEKGFVEIAANTPVALLVRYSCKLIAPGKPAGYGSTSEASSISSLSVFGGSNIRYDLKLPDDYKVIPSREYFLKKGERSTKITNTRQVAQLFPGREKEIELFAKTNGTNFQNTDDLIKLVLFCNSKR